MYSNGSSAKKDTKTNDYFCLNTHKNMLKCANSKIYDFHLLGGLVGF